MVWKQESCKTRQASGGTTEPEAKQGAEGEDRNQGQTMCAGQLPVAMLFMFHMLFNLVLDSNVTRFGIP